MLGAVRVSLWDIYRAFTGSFDTAPARIIVLVRLPRLLAAAVAGAALSCSGLITQTVLLNPMASPGVIGVNAGSGLAAAILLALFRSNARILPLAAFIGAMCACLIVFGVARMAGGSRVTVILAGVALSSLMSAGINTLTALAPDALAGIHDFQVGGFAGTAPAALLPSAVTTVAGIGAALFFSGELEALSLGESSAHSLGVSVAVFRMVFLVLASALAGSAVSLAGLLGFVGLIVPHIVRFVLRDADTQVRLMGCALIGAAFVVTCDTASRTAFAPRELPVGILTAYIGVPLFLYLLFREKRRGSPFHG